MFLWCKLVNAFAQRPYLSEGLGNSRFHPQIWCFQTGRPQRIKTTRWAVYADRYKWSEITPIIPQLPIDFRPFLQLFSSLIFVGGRVCPGSNKDVLLSENGYCQMEKLVVLKLISFTSRYSTLQLSSCNKDESWKLIQAI